jgi:hypothetical protein
MGAPPIPIAIEPAPSVHNLLVGNSLIEGLPPAEQAGVGIVVE